jgi:hypothetical protein
MMTDKLAALRGHYCDPDKPKPSRRKGRSPVQERDSRLKLRYGWYTIGFPKLNPYLVEDLVGYWRACVWCSFASQWFRQNHSDSWLAKLPNWLPGPRPPWRTRAGEKSERDKVLDWLRDRGHKHCEAIVYAGVLFWDNLRDECHLDDADFPRWSATFGFRRGLEMRWTALLRSRENLGECPDPRFTETWKKKGGYEKETTGTAAATTGFPVERKRMGNATATRQYPGPLLENSGS